MLWKVESNLVQTANEKVEKVQRQAEIQTLLRTLNEDAEEERATKST